MDHATCYSLQKNKLVLYHIFHDYCTTHVCLISFKCFWIQNLIFIYQTQSLLTCRLHMCYTKKHFTSQRIAQNINHDQPFGLHQLGKHDLLCDCCSFLRNLCSQKTIHLDKICWFKQENGHDMSELLHCQSGKTRNFSVHSGQLDQMHVRRLGNMDKL